MLKIIKNKIQEIVSAVKESRKAKREAKRDAVIDSIRIKLSCKKINKTASLMVTFGGKDLTMGYYTICNKQININMNVAKGLFVIDSLFHEDRHYQQDIAGKLYMSRYIEHGDDYLAYLQQHVETDARRYAFVQTIKFLKEYEEINIVSRYLAIFISRKLLHPFNGWYWKIVYKKLRKEQQKHS